MCSSSHLVSFAQQTYCHDLTSSLVSWDPKSIHPPEGLAAGAQGMLEGDLRSQARKLWGSPGWPGSWAGWGAAGGSPQPRASACVSGHGCGSRGRQTSQENSSPMWKKPTTVETVLSFPPNIQGCKPPKLNHTSNPPKSPFQEVLHIISKKW